LKIKYKHNDVYGWTFVFIDSDDPDEVFKKFGIECNDVAGCGRHFFGKEEAIFIIVNSKHKIFDAGVLAHECGHAVGFLFSDLGIKADHTNDEPYQYMLAWLVRNFCKTMGFEMVKKS